MAYDIARQTAAKALVAFAKGVKTADAAIAFEKLGTKDRDRAFAGAVFFGCAERLVTLDYLLRPLMKKNLEKLDAPVLAILRTGLYQMLYMRVPQSAAVNESVKLAKVFGFSSATGFVNAVLRKAADIYADMRTGDKPNLANLEFENEKQRVCVAYSVSEKVADIVMSALPKEYDAFFANSFSTGEICIRVNTLRTDVGALTEDLLDNGAVVRAGGLENCLYVKFGAAIECEQFLAKGFYHVQGEASQWACHNLGVEKGMRVLDLCAAPGGKSATIAQELANTGELTCCDVSDKRLVLARENMARLGIEKVKVSQGDASLYNELLCGQDRVLCDVPCSSLGVMAQKPDLRYTKGERFDDLPELQLKILRNAFRYVKKGGRLLYSTCTIRKEENMDVVKAFLAGAESARIIPPKAVPAGAQLENDMMTILPQNTGTDGFFMAVMEKMW